MRLAFGDCVFDSGTREVLRGGHAAALPQKAFSLLELLISRRPNAVSKEEIHEHLWPGTYVSDASVANLVADLRAALGDDARKPRTIRTVHRFGYAFRADVKEAEARATPSISRVSCRILWDGREIHLRDGENVIGREPDAVIWIDDASVSRRHARIVVGADGASLDDLGSKNGTRLQGERIRKVSPLKDRDVIQIGPASMVVRVYRAVGTTETAIGEGPTR